MAYYKIIQNGNVIDASEVCLKWQEKHRCLLLCDINDAEYIQSHDESTLYHDSWLKPITQISAPSYTNATIVVIEQAQYEEIRAMLDDGATIPEIVDPIPSEQETNPEPIEPPITPEPEQMTLAQMRQKILDQQAQIAMLTDCLLEMSEIVYA